VLLVDDHPPLLQQVSRLLDKEFEVVGTLPDGTALLDAAESQNPDLIVLDISLPGESGLRLAQRLREAGCKARLVFLTVHCDIDYAQAAFLSGASGYVVKGRLASDLVTALRAVLGGGRFVSPCPELASVQEPDQN
jgi:DNA-binding NarL/FixJ family response regulator